ncbi:MAG: membrane dipeptidase [Deltaproteobacteria bacterium]|nr:membrane dipeptidase [Deltaproteobacteria bacterium]
MGRVLFLAAGLLTCCRARVPEPPIEAAPGGVDSAAGEPRPAVEVAAAGGDDASAFPVAADAAGGPPSDEDGTEGSGEAMGEAGEPFAGAIAVDLHTDVVMQVAEHGRDFMADDGEWTLERARRGGLDAQVFPLWISPRETDQEAALKRAERAFRSMIEGSGGALAVVRTAAEIRERAAAGEMSALLGLEGTLALGEDPASVDPLIAMGLRYLGLTWNASNAFAEAAADEREPHGLTEAGKRLVERANDAGVLIDLSHASARTFWDAYRWSRSPLLVSHAGLRALRDIPRNIDDLQLLAVARSGGVVGIVWHSGFLMELGEGETVAPLSALLDAYDHAKALGAAGALGLGSDLDGGIHPPAELATIDLLPALPVGLRERGWTDEEIAGVLGENFLRLLDVANAAVDRGEDAEAAAAREWPADVRVMGVPPKDADLLHDRMILPGPSFPDGTVLEVTWAEDEAADAADAAVLEMWGEAHAACSVSGADAGTSDPVRLELDERGSGRLELPEALVRDRLIRIELFPPRPRQAMESAPPPVRIDEIAVWLREGAEGEEETEEETTDGHR